MSAQTETPSTVQQQEAAPVQLVLNIQVPNTGDPNQAISMEELQKQIALQVAALTANPQAAAAIAAGQEQQRIAVPTEQGTTADTQTEARTAASATAVSAATFVEGSTVQAVATIPAAQTATPAVSTDSSVPAQPAVVAVQAETSTTTIETTSATTQNTTNAQNVAATPATPAAPAATTTATTTTTTTTTATAAAQGESQSAAGTAVVQVTIVQAEATSGVTPSGSQQVVTQATTDVHATVNTDETTAGTSSTTATETATATEDTATGTETAAEDTATEETPVPEKKARPVGDGPRKRALIIGINYIGTSSELGGCIADAQNVQGMLKKIYGYLDENIRLLTDDQTETANIPTKENIYSGIEWLLDEAKANDALFLYFSGHGSAVDDSDGDEVDGKDEAICPSDMHDAGVITDDELNRIVVRNVPHGARLTAVFDSCHSGSVMDLPYMYSLDGKPKYESLFSTATKGLLSAGLSYMNGDTTEMYDTLSTLGSRLLTTRHKEHKNKYTKGSKADVVMFSGCRDDQYSYVAYEENKCAGALTYALIKSVEENPNPTYRQLLCSIREKLHIRYEQLPEFSASHEIDLDTIFAA
ncbi:caspase domain-containing protein [Dichotomocladium elegans]|nr:caspase domain-containing protein [Dichotomocladium elegans]